MTQKIEKLIRFIVAAVIVATLIAGVFGSLVSDVYTGSVVPASIFESGAGEFAWAVALLLSAALSAMQIADNFTEKKIVGTLPTVFFVFFVWLVRIFDTALFDIPGIVILMTGKEFTPDIDFFLLWGSLGVYAKILVGFLGVFQAFAEVMAVWIASNISEIVSKVVGWAKREQPETPQRRRPTSHVKSQPMRPVPVAEIRAAKWREKSSHMEESDGSVAQERML